MVFFQQSRWPNCYILEVQLLGAGEFLDGARGDTVDSAPGERLQGLTSELFTFWGVFGFESWLQVLKFFFILFLGDLFANPRINFSSSH